MNFFGGLVKSAFNELDDIVPGVNFGQSGTSYVTSTTKSTPNFTNGGQPLFGGKSLSGFTNFAELAGLGGNSGNNGGDNDGKDDHFLLLMALEAV